jgi:hypothetical protein
MLPCNYIFFRLGQVPGIAQHLPGTFWLLCFSCHRPWSTVFELYVWPNPLFLVILHLSCGCSTPSISPFNCLRLETRSRWKLTLNLLTYRFSVKIFYSSQDSIGVTTYVCIQYTYSHYILPGHLNGRANHHAVQGCMLRLPISRLGSHTFRSMGPLV